MTKGNETVTSLGNFSLITNASMFSNILTKQAELSDRVMKVKASFDGLIVESEEKDFEQDARLNNAAITYSEARQETMGAMRDWYVEAARKTVESAVDQSQFEKREKRVHAIINGWKSILTKTTPLGMDESEEEEDAEWLKERNKNFPDYLVIPSNLTSSPDAIKASNSSAISNRLRSKSKSVASAISGMFTPPRSSTPEGCSKGGRKKSTKEKSPRRKSIANAKKQKAKDNDDVFEEEAPPPPASNNVEIVDEVAASVKNGGALGAMKGDEEENSAPASAALVDDIFEASGAPSSKEEAEERRRKMEERTKKTALQIEDMKRELEEREEQSKKAMEERKKIEKEMEEAKKKEKEEEEEREKESTQRASV